MLILKVYAEWFVVSISLALKAPVMVFVQRARLLRLCVPLCVMGTSLLMTAATLHASTSAIEDGFADQRKRFVAAERAWRIKDLKHYRALKRELADYPLLPNLEYRELKGRLSKASHADVEAFLNRYAELPVAQQLRSQWLGALAKKQAWKAYRRFDQASKSNIRKCRTAWSLYKTGERKQAFEQALTLWLVGKSQVKQCDSLFQAWKATGGVTPELVWNRFRLAVRKGETGLARFLQRELSGKRLRLSLLWLQIRNNPQQIHDPFLRSDTADNRELVVYGFSRLASRNSQIAASLWYKLKDRYAFDAHQRAKLQSQIAFGAMRAGNPNASDWLPAVPLASNGVEGELDPETVDRVLRVAIAAGKWKLARQWIEGLPPAEQLQDRWRYWLARAMEASDDAHEARKLFAGLSLSRGYYNFLAADRIGVPYTLGDRPVHPSEAVSDHVSIQPGVLRAREWYLLRRMVDARREWRVLSEKLDRVQLRAAAKLAGAWGWHDRAIITAAKSGHFDDLKLRFPLAYQSIVSRHAGAADLNMAWVYALMRQESAFAKDARSPVGARGLMQLMPATAKYVARKLRANYRKASQLFNPDTNVQFGTFYLREVLDQLGNNPILATAAYNAGPHRVKRWLPKNGQTMDADIWIELIPFKETRKYVKRILEYSVVYETRMGLVPSRVSDRMPSIGSTVPSDGAHRGGAEQSDRLTTTQTRPARDDEQA